MQCGIIFSSHFFNCFCFCLDFFRLFVKTGSTPFFQMVLSWRLK
uniref:Uncharacterized protein n=1 Tax=Anguilla anguilla TaxID=7936 RepID=A0A0E9W642_ANGAN